MSTRKMDTVLAAIGREAARAHMRYGDFTSAHEAYGVLAEEVGELLEAIRSNNPEAVYREALQVSAVAYRLALLAELAMRGERDAFRARSGWA